jgi:effector-binding domain-containing protein
MILFIPDTAKQLQDLGAVFQRGYGELMKYAHENQLKTGKFLAWYYSVQPPWIMDIGVETDKLPSELKGRVKSRIEKGGEVLIAHMQGPYTQLGEAYNQIESWLKQNNRMARGNPFEIYLNDPSTVKDPSEIKTDIYQPLQ